MCINDGRCALAKSLYRSELAHNAYGCFETENMYCVWAPSALKDAAEMCLIKTLDALIGITEWSCWSLSVMHHVKVSCLPMLQALCLF